MAYDKLVDSSFLDAGLKSIADAIRAKGGTSDSLAFPTAMAEAVAAIEAGGGVELPELTNPGTAGDLVAGKQLIDGDGNVVVGTIKRVLGGIIAQVEPDFTLANGIKAVQFSYTPEEPSCISKSTGGVYLRAPLTEFGDATAEDVAKGKTFTSAAGLLAVGTREETSVEPDPLEQYQRVEYIESATEGTYPYIITDFCADNSCGVEVIASFPTLVDRIPVGSRENSDPTRFYCVYPLSANSIYYGFDAGVTISCKLTVDTIYRLQTNFLNSRLVNVYTEDGTRKCSGSISDTLTQQTAPVSIFGYNYASTGTVSSKREFKLYGARMSRGHEVVREYIPCYRKSDGIVGVYEKFTGTFLTNADADGDGSGFAKGADIEW